ncbi:MAG: HD domain-containing protein [Nitriliruptorales bacterium]|nr:HD domain-containing protein [Nitriliruptorales bacterium]
MPSLSRRTRTDREVAEEQLSPGATRSVATRGRDRAEEPDPDRTCFEVDRDRILHSKAFRRLKHKTQVFMVPDGDHYVTRLTHALQVTQVARALAVGLGLNEPLAEAIALGHDVGHSPFGHTGEDALSPYFDGGWHHAAQSVRIYDALDPANLTWEVRDGIRAHTWRIEPPPATPEAHCVRFADRIAYLSHDAQDAVRAGILRPGEFPASALGAFGPPGGRWIGEMIRAVLDYSPAAGSVAMRPDCFGIMGELRGFMFERVYTAARHQDEHDAAVRVIRRLVDYHLEHPHTVPVTYRDNDADVVTQVADYVAGMTDRFALNAYEKLFGERPAALNGRVE